MGQLSQDGFTQIIKLLNRLGITAEMLRKFDVDAIIKNMLIDKKNKNGEIYMVILNDIGQVFTLDDKVATVISSDIVKQAFTRLF